MGVRTVTSVVCSSGLAKILTIAESEQATDKEEAERLARAIERTHVDWIEIQDIEHNPLTGKYELKCRYQRYRALIGWTELRIKSPRQWIDLLTKREGGLGNGWELP